MAILTITDQGSESGWTLDGGRTYTAEVEVLTDGPTVGARAVLDALNLFADTSYRWPLTTTATESDARCLLQSVKVSPTSADRRTWRAVLEFAPRSWEGQEKGPVDEDGNRDPFAARPTVRARSEVEEVAATTDREGAPILNKAGDPFDPPMVRTRRTTVFEVSRVERFFDGGLIDDFEDHLNADAWMGFPAESVKCLSISAGCEYNDDVQGYVWTVDYTFGYRRPVDVGGEVVSGWAEVVLNAGYRQLVSGERKAIMVDNAPVSAPVPLKSDGTAADPSDDPVYLAFNILPTADFDGLGLPTDLFSIGTAEPDPPEEP